MAQATGRGLGCGKRLVFVGITLLGLVVLGELVLQVYYYTRAGAFLFQRLHPPILEADPLRCYRLRPDLDYPLRTNEFSTTVYTNSKGFRTDSNRRDLPYEKSKDVYRILFLGPSLTFGWGSEWEDSYPAIIARELRIPGKRIEILNLGTPAQDLAAQLCWLQREGFRYEPDLVVSAVYGTEIPAVPAACPAELRCPHVSADGTISGAKPTLARRLKAAAKSIGYVFYGFYAYHTLWPAAVPPDDGVGTGKELYSEEERQTGVAPAKLGAIYQANVDFVQEILGPEVGVAFVHIPLSFVVHEQDVGRWSHLLDASPLRARADIAAGVAALEDAGIALVDSTSALLERADEERLYFWLDIHPTPAGNRVIAEAALPVLQGLVGGESAAPDAAPGR